MAAVTTSKHGDEDVSPMPRTSTEILSDSSPLVRTTDDEESPKRNVYVSSPLRSEQTPSTVEPRPRPRAPLRPLRVKTDEFRMPPSLPFALPKTADAAPLEADSGSIRPSPEPGVVAAAAAAAAADVARVGGDGDSSPSHVAWKRRTVSGTATPPDRRSVQFASGTNDEAGPTPLAKSATWETDEDGEDENIRGRQSSSSFFSKLKQMATPTAHTRTPSTGTGISTPHAALSPQSERSEPMYPVPTEEVERGTEADEEDSYDDDDQPERRSRRPRKRKRPTLGGTESLPSTPRASRFASFIRDRPIPGRASSRPPPSRQNTVSEESDDGRAGVSEDEGRDRLRAAWRRGIEGARGLSYTARKDREEESSEKRPGHLRRLTGFGGGDSSAPFRPRADKHNSASAQKWRQVKAGIRMLGQRQKNERMKIDHQKSAQLMAELLAGAPAALIFASMFQRDEHHHRKVPVLLEQLKISIPDVQSRTDKSGDRDYIYRVNLEYGNGPARMKWTIYRSITDFVNLHLKYKAQEASDRVRHLTGDDKTKPKIPRFPKSAIPYARGIRGLLERVQDEEDELEIPETPGVGNVDGETNTNSPTTAVRPGTAGKGHRRKPSSFFVPPQRQNTSEIGNKSLDPEALTARQKQLYREKSQQKLETYLQQMIRWLIFRPDSTRLCKFLEVSAMAIRLSAETGYQGKQGLLQIASRRHQEMRRKTLQSFGPHALKERHKRRWFLVRHSYIVCVDGPESLTPYDVFLVDSDFSIEKERKKILDQKTAQDMARIATEKAKPGKKAHLIQLFNSERKIKLYARNEKQYLQFQDSIHHMIKNTPWSQKHRYASFAPVRNHVWARWLVDGRDHMWQVSRAIDNARDCIYIHDWWLSPELYMRRPAAISQKWRLDRLLQRKAQEGVKIFVIVYRNVESAIPIDSEYTKWSLMDLHPNICVQRSPNQLRQNQFFWAHHEKLVVVDNMMGFVGGVDLCFGRWDDPCHSLTDDKLTGFELDQDVPRDSEHCQMWPGKDYSNPRVQDFYNLDRPYEEMYDRTKVPRMPWHDIAMQIVGQPARDVARHFVQRWNFILRSRVPSRPTPVLMPPPEYDHEELERLGMTGTCEIQILRSAAHWSLGTPNKVEHSIMNAYYHLIKNSDHFVYIENQFFITSTTVDSTRIVNKIGDAIVERAKRAHEENKAWQICLVIPLMPGFQSTVDAQDGTSIRLIMSCQYRSICRGEDSIFGRLRAEGIDPEDYVRFYSLRKWGKIGPRKCLTTEQLYIHAKCMVVDDRTVIIGSANINERSMLGSRDSEVAAVVTDTDMIPSSMGGEPYAVGRFPHTLRKRLMREHLGIDVDAIYRSEQIIAERETQDAEMQRIYGEHAFTPSKEYFETPPQTPLASELPSRNLDVPATGFIGRSEENRGSLGAANTDTSSSAGDPESKDFKKGLERELDVEGYGPDNMKRLAEAGDIGLRDSFVDSHGREVLLRKDAPNSKRIKEQEEEALSRQRSENRERNQDLPVRPPWPTERLVTRDLGLPTRSTLPDLPVLDDTDIGGPALNRGPSNLNKIVDQAARSLRRPEVHEDCMTDPLASSFFHDIWHKVAENNTKIYRQVFRCQPDSEILDWKSYERANDFTERFMQSQGLGKSVPRSRDAPVKSGPPGAGGISPIQDSFPESVKSKSRFAELREKLRPGSRSTTEPNHAEGVHEKEKRATPDSPDSGVSSGPTAVPSPDPRPLDEKATSRGGTPPDEHNPDHTGDHFDEKDATKQEEPPTEDAVVDNSTSETINRLRTITISDSVNHTSETTAIQSQHSHLHHTASQKRRRRGTTKSGARPPNADLMGREEAEDLLGLVQGHLVLWPYDWLEKEERNWLYAVDQLAPLEIYD